MSVMMLLFLKNGLCLLMLLLPMMTYVLKQKQGKRVLQTYWITCVLFYGLLVLLAWLSDVYFDKVLQSYDVNQNGFFEDDEMILAQQQAMRDVVNDTGRRLVIFTGLIISPVVVGIYFMVLSVVCRVINKILRDKKQTA